MNILNVVPAATSLAEIAKIEHVAARWGATGVSTESETRKLFDACSKRKIELAAEGSGLFSDRDSDELRAAFEGAK